MATITAKGDDRAQGVLRIRHYRPEDRQQVVGIFRKGMVGLAGVGCKQLIRAQRPLQALTVALPAAAFMLIPRRHGLLTKAFAGLVASAMVPLGVFAVLRHFMGKYVAQSLEEDMSNIEAFYSSAGAGHGSAFWVAELVLDAPASQPLTLPSRIEGVRPQMPRVASSGATSSFSVASSSAASAASPVIVTTSTSVAASTSSSATESAVMPAASDNGNDDRDPTSTTPDLNVDAEGAIDEDGYISVEAPGGADGNAHGAQSHREGARLSSEGGEVRRLVAGIVAATVAKLEAGISIPSTPPSPATPAHSASRKAPAPAPSSPASTPPVPDSSTSALVPTSPEKEAPLAADKGSKAGLNSAARQALSNASFSGPATPVAPAEPRSQRSYTALEPSPPLKPSASASRLRPPSSNDIAALAAATATPASNAPSTTAAAARAAPRSVIVGCVALERKTWQVAELRRMSVAPGFRGMGIGRRLLEALTQNARDNQFREIILTTSSMQLPAQRLYESAGWELTVKQTWKGIDLFTYKLDLIKKR